MNVTLPRELEEFVLRKAANGEYPSADAVVVEALLEFQRTVDNEGLPGWMRSLPFDRGGARPAPSHAGRLLRAVAQACPQQQREVSQRVQYAPWFDADLHQTAWYAQQGGDELAERFVNADETTVNELAENPHLGWRPYQRDPDLTELYSVLVERPFRKHLLFYRFTEEELFLERLIHGARDLPRRLRESPFESD